MLTQLLLNSTIPLTFIVSKVIHQYIHSCNTAKSTGPDIPSHAPQWVHSLSQYGQYMDRTKLYDIQGHLLFDSLLSTNGIQYFSYYMSAEYVSKAEYAFSRTARGTNAHIGFTADELTSQLDPNSSGPEVYVAFHLGSNVCGHKGIVHGGLTATIIDEVSGAAAFAAVGPCFTANLNVNYIRPLPANTWVLVKSQVYKQVNRKAYIKTTVEDGMGNSFASGEALFIRPRLDVHTHSDNLNHKK